MPTSNTRWFSQSVIPVMSRPTLTTERPDSCSRVSALTRREVCRAALMTLVRVPDASPEACAAFRARRSCPVISRSPTTIDSSPEATRNRWVRASSPSYTTQSGWESSSRASLRRRWDSGTFGESIMNSSRLQVAKVTRPSTPAVLLNEADRVSVC